MSESRPRKHRHDGPDVAHGARNQERTTAVLQALLGLCIVLTAALLLYSVLAAGSEPPV